MTMTRKVENNDEENNTQADDDDDDDDEVDSDEEDDEEDNDKEGRNDERGITQIITTATKGIEDLDKDGGNGNTEGKERGGS